VRMAWLETPGARLSGFGLSAKAAAPGAAP
jgi:hypothetical protein